MAAVLVAQNLRNYHALFDSLIEEDFIVAYEGKVRLERMQNRGRFAAGTLL